VPEGDCEALCSPLSWGGSQQAQQVHHLPNSIKRIGRERLPTIRRLS
jgi:hypothetical protein